MSSGSLIHGWPIPNNWDRDLKEGEEEFRSLKIIF